MLSLILYCGLISSVVSAHFINDTSHDGGEDDINTTLSTLASTTIPVSKDCVLEMKENEISQMVELFNSATVNIIDIHIIFSKINDSKQPVSDFHVSLSDDIGREILCNLDAGLPFTFVTFTLKAGIRNFKLNVKGSQNDCVKSMADEYKFVLESFEYVRHSINLARSYFICSSSNRLPLPLFSFQIRTTNLTTKFSYNCREAILPSLV